MERSPFLLSLSEGSRRQPVGLSKKKRPVLRSSFFFIYLTEQTIEQIVKLPVILCTCDATVMFVW